MNSVLTLSLLQATLQAAAPLILAAMGGVISHQAGIFNFSLEGLMLFGAFFAVYGVIVTNGFVVLHTFRRRFSFSMTPYGGMLR